MRKSVPAISFTVCGLIMTLILMAGSPAAAAPKAEIPETTHDFGKVFEDKELTHTFIIKNTGDAPLHIKDIDPDWQYLGSRENSETGSRRTETYTTVLKGTTKLRDGTVFLDPGKVNFRRWRQERSGPIPPWSIFARVQPSA